MLKHHIHTITTRKSKTLRTNSVKIVYLTKPYAYTNIFKDLYDLVADYLLNLERSMLSGSSSCAGNSRRSVGLQGDHEDPGSRRVFSASLRVLRNSTNSQKMEVYEFVFRNFSLGAVVKMELSFTFREKYRISWVDE